MYLVGKFGNSDVTYEYGFKMTENPENSSEHYITKKLEVGDMFAGWHKGWDMWVAKIENSDMGSKFEVVTVDGKSYIKVKAGAAGTYTLYCKHYGGDNDQFWISEFKPSEDSIILNCADGSIKFTVVKTNGYVYGLSSVNDFSEVFLHVWNLSTDVAATGGWGAGKLNNTYTTTMTMSQIDRVIVAADPGGQSGNITIDTTKLHNGVEIKLDGEGIKSYN